MHNDALQINDQVASVEIRVDTLVKELQGIFLNGSIPLETTQDIIDKDVEERKVVEDMK